MLTQHRFQPQNPLSGAQQFVAKDPQDDDDLKLCSHTMMLPTRGQLEGRMIVTAYEHGLDNVTEEAVSAVVYAVEVGGLLVEITTDNCDELVCGKLTGTECHSLSSVKERHFTPLIGWFSRQVPYSARASACLLI